MTKGEVDDLKSGSRRHHQSFTSDDVLPGLCCSCLQFLIDLVAFSLHVHLQQVKYIFSWIHLWLLTWPFILCFKKDTGCFQFAWAHCPFASWSTVQPVLEHLAEYEQRMLAETLQNSPCSFCQQSLNIREPVSLVAILTPLHHHLHSSLLRWHELDLEQLNPFSMLFSSHHSGTNWYLSHLSIGCCSRTKKLFFVCLFFW